MIKVNVQVDNKFWVKKIKNIKKYFDIRLKKISKVENLFKKKNLTFTILLTNSRNIKKINKKFRKKNKPTDILSFPFEKKIDLDKNLYLGDIVISYEFINVPILITSLEFKKKLVKTFIHGFLHLLNYDHIKLKDYKKMISEELKIYKLVYKKIEQFI